MARHRLPLVDPKLTWTCGDVRFAPLYGAIVLTNEAWNKIEPNDRPIVTAAIDVNASMTAENSWRTNVLIAGLPCALSHYRTEPRHTGQERRAACTPMNSGRAGSHTFKTE